MERTRTRGALCGLLCALALVLMSSAFAVSREKRETGQEGYQLRDCGGYVAVYEAGGRGPMTVTEIETALLPEQDRILLQRGLPAADREELLLLLEDLGS